MAHPRHPDRELRVPLAGDMLSEARDVAWAALARTDARSEPRIHYRALYATDRLGSADAMRRSGAFRLLSADELDVLADCAALLIASADAEDAALLRKARRLADLALIARE